MVVFLPAVSEDRYDALKRVMGEAVPASYADWLEQGTAWKTFWGKEDETKFVPIDPSDYDDYIKERDLPANLNTLMGFAEWVFKAKPPEAAT